LSTRYRFRDSDPVVHDSAAANVAAAYNQAGGDYVAYADGDPTHLFAFNGLHAYANRRIWTVLEAKLTHLRATGAQLDSYSRRGLRSGYVAAPSRHARPCVVSYHHYRAWF
jgi:hypothetical protein